MLPILKKIKKISGCKRIKNKKKIFKSITWHTAYKLIYRLTYEEN